MGPMIIDMRDAVPGQHLQIVKPEEAGVPNLNRVPKVTREVQKKLIEP
jgi:hypothetical protein